MNEPFSGEPTDEAQKRAQAHRALVKAYRGTFDSAHGRLVLADLKKKFGFDRWEAESETLSDNTIARRVAMKGPIFEIERMRAMPLDKPPRRTRALYSAQ